MVICPGFVHGNLISVDQTGKGSFCCGVTLLSIWAGEAILKPFHG
jgi:hypothetical protein